MINCSDISGKNAFTTKWLEGVIAGAREQSVVHDAKDGRFEVMQAKIIVFPSENGFSVLIWGKWASGSIACAPL